MGVFLVVLLSAILITVFLNYLFRISNRSKNFNENPNSEFKKSTDNWYNKANSKSDDYLNKIEHPKKAESYLRQDEISIEKSDNSKGKYLILDTETTGLPPRKTVYEQELESWPSILQISWILLDQDFKFIEIENHFINFKSKIPYEAQRINKITTDILLDKGEDIKEVLQRFLVSFKNCKIIVAHNIDFDLPIIEAELARLDIFFNTRNKIKICTMTTSRYFVNITDRYGRIKSPKLEELYLKCFCSINPNSFIDNLHNAETDVLLTYKCFRYLVENKIIDEKGKLMSAGKFQAIPDNQELNDAFTYYEVHHDREYFDGHIPISGLVLKQGIVKIISSNNPFFGKKVVITGVFNNWKDRTVIAQILQQLGADIDVNITKRTNLLIEGKEESISKHFKMIDNIRDGLPAEIIGEYELIRRLKAIKPDYNSGVGK